MAKRILSDQEKRLWKLYTRDVEAINADGEPSKIKESAGSYEIKIPKKEGFKKTIQPNLTNQESLKDRDSNWGRKLRQGKVKIDGKIDLHGMTCVQAHQKLHRYLERAQQSGKRVILVVTGKGGPKTDFDHYRFSEFENNRGVLRREVPMWLSGSAMRHLIVSFQEARSQDGGAGALYVVLKRSS